MARITTTIALVAILLPASAWAASPPPSDAELCESAKLKAASTFAQCRGKADSVYAKTSDAAKRQASYDKCEEKLLDAYAKAEAKFPGQCPSVGDVDAVRDYLSQCTDDVGAATAPGGSVPDYVAELASCSADLGSAQAQLTACNSDKTACQSSLATAQAGTATAGQVLSGRTFTSAAGIGATGTMPNNGAVALTPGTASQTIPAGYHNGSGTVAGDPDLVAGNIKSGTSIFGVTGTVVEGPTITNGLLKTGQTTSYGTGSDGAVQAGTAQSFTDNGNGTVTDNRTGLMWEKKSDDGGIHDKDTTYTWGQSVSPYSMNGTMVTTFLAALNTAPCFAGYCDWRIPNLTELESIRNLEVFGPATFPAFNTSCTAGCTVTACSCTVSSYYWSSSTYRYNPAAAWFVTFDTGGVGGSYKTNDSYHYVRAVRGGS